MENICLKFFTRNRSRMNAEHPHRIIVHSKTIDADDRNRSSAAPSANSFSPLLIQRLSRPTRSTVEHHSNVENEFKSRTRLNARTPSPAGNPCASYCSYPKKNRLKPNSFLVDEQCRDIHSSNQGLANGGLIPSDISDRSSSFENTLGNDEQRRYRYSQRAVAQFMHQRNKARLRRNQKASRTLGKKIESLIFPHIEFVIFIFRHFTDRFSHLLASIYHFLSTDGFLSESIFIRIGKYHILAWLCQFSIESISVRLQFTKFSSSNR